MISRTKELQMKNQILLNFYQLLEYRSFYKFTKSKIIQEQFKLNTIKNSSILFKKKRISWTKIQEE